MIRWVICTLLLSVPVIGRADPQQKVISIKVDAKGEIFIGRDTLQVSGLAAELQQRLWKSYLGTGKMYDSISIEFTGEVLMGTRGATLDAIQNAQKNALAEICLQKYKRLFENCSGGEQRKIRKQFPVLFQEIH